MIPMCCEHEIKLYIVAHRPLVHLPPRGSELIRADKGEGDNISDKEDYCELRAHYWVWKNTTGPDEDYIGFFHYRRYLDFEGGEVVELPSKERPVAYRIAERPKENIGVLAEKLRELDVIAPTWEYTGISVFERYGRFLNQRTHDLEMIMEIIHEKYPAYIQAAEDYLHGKGEYYGNIFIMRRRIFQDYCTWLFSILGEFDRRITDAPQFADGHLGERLFGIYFTWLSRQKEIRCGEVPRVHYWIYDDKEHHYKNERWLNLLLPPGSQLRSFVRRLHYCLKGF